MRTGYSADDRTKRVALSAMLLAAALMISYAESLLPRIVPMPGFKPGFANLAVMAAFCISPACAASVSVSRVIIFALLFGSPVSFSMSASGAALSYLILMIIRTLKFGRISWIGVSVLSAIFHSTGQVVCAAVLTGTPAVLYYLPLLLVSALICGSLCGVLMNRVQPIISEYAKDNSHKNK